MLRGLSGHRLRDDKRSSHSLLLAGLAFLLCLTLTPQARAQNWALRANQEEHVKQLFGSAWEGRTGPFRVVNGRLAHSRATVTFAAEGRTATLTLEHPDDLQENPDNDAAFTLIAREKGLGVTATCLPRCSDQDVAALHQLAEQVLERYAGDLFISTAGAEVVPDREERTRQAHPSRAGRILNAWNCSLALFALWPLLGVLSFLRVLKSGKHRQAMRDALVIFVATIAAAVALTEPGLANWYTDFLPAIGRGSDLHDQLGTGALVFEMPFRRVFPWTDRTLFNLTLAAFSAGAALMFLAFRALHIPREACLLMSGFLAVNPLAIRAGWSASPHAIVFLLFALLMLAWLRAQEPGHVPELLLALVLIPTLALTRAESVIFAAIPGIWGIQHAHGKRRLALAALYAGVLGASAWLAWVLVVLPSGAPIPDTAARINALTDLFTRGHALIQFFRPNSGDNWFPVPLAWLAVAGVIVLAVQQTHILIKTIVTILLPQIVLTRFINAEGLVGIRYFMPVLPLLSLLAAAPISSLIAPKKLASNPKFRRAILAGDALAILLVLAFSWPIYHRRYTYQEEYNFLRTQLTNLPHPCRIFHIAVQGDALYRSDPDCCVNPGRSPLTLAHPGIAFEPLNANVREGRIPASEESCQYYYESALCSYGPTRETENRNPGVAAHLRETCAEHARDPRLTLVAFTTVPTHATWLFFSQSTATIRLFRVSAPIQATEHPNSIP